MCDYDQAFNGELGTVVAIAGEDYVVIGSDTRLARYNALLSRTQPKLFPMGERCILGAVGFRGDVVCLKDDVRTQMVTYELTQERSLGSESLAQMISVLLSTRRKPYLVFSVLAGLNANDRGSVFGFCPTGAFWRASFCVVGSAAKFVQPILDSQINAGHGPADRTDMPLKSAVTLMQDVFAVAGERDVFTGDSLRVSVLTKGGVKETCYPLRRD